MSMSPFHAIHAFSLFAVLAANPLGCDGGSSVEAVSLPPVLEPDPGTGASGGSSNASGGPTVTPPNANPGAGSPPPPQGGTPEPGTLLLLGGSAAGYLALRRRRKPDAGDVRADA